MTHILQYLLLGLAAGVVSGLIGIGGEVVILGCQFFLGWVAGFKVGDWSLGCTARKGVWRCNAGDRT